MYKYLHGEKIPGTQGISNLANKGRTRPSGWKLKPDLLQFEIRHRCFTVYMINHWNKLPKAVVPKEKAVKR